VTTTGVYRPIAEKVESRRGEWGARGSDPARAKTKSARTAP